MRQISGTYEGLGRDVELTLRLDVDGPTALNMLSGELNQSVRLQEFNYFNLRQHSFIGDEITREVEGNRVTFSAPIRFFRLPELTGSIEVEIEPTSAVARLKVTGYGYHRQPFTFALNKVSDYFRDIRLEIDFEAGTELPEPFEPWSVGTRPAGMPEEPVTIQGAFQGSGIDVVVEPQHTQIPPAEAGADARWTEAELHAAMISHFSLISSDPTWNVYLLIGREFVVPGVSGIMFDQTNPLPRQGVAVFYRHFENLPDGIRQRNYLCTTIHELGHALNLLHSFQKGVFSEFGFGDNPFMMPRSDSLSYMNYPWRYPFGHNMPPGWNGTPDYWARFPFAFDDIELMHLRHHDRLEVIFGGEAFGIHGHNRMSNQMPAQAERQNAASALQLELRAKRVLAQEVRAYECMEPVSLELKVACKGEEDVEISSHLDPSYGVVAVYLQKPDGTVARFRPLMTACTEGSEQQTLTPGVPVYQNLHLTYGRDGFSFDEPGFYQVCAVYQGGERFTTYSNVLSIYVGAPQSRETEALAADFFDPSKGELLAVGPSASSRFSAQIDFFREVVDRLPGTALGRHLAGYLAMVHGVPFKDLTRIRLQEEGAPTTKLRLATTRASTKDALFYLKKARTRPASAQESLSNLCQYRLEIDRARIYEASGDVEKAKAAVGELKDFVAKAVGSNNKLRKQALAALDEKQARIGQPQSILAAE